jgi:hypothetical protein
MRRTFSPSGTWAATSLGFRARDAEIGVHRGIAHERDSASVVREQPGVRQPSALDFRAHNTIRVDWPIDRAYTINQRLFETSLTIVVVDRRETSCGSARAQSILGYHPDELMAAAPRSFIPMT